MSRRTNLITSGGLAMAGGLAIATALGGCSKPPPTGACCAADGSCTVTKQAECNARWTLGGVCEPNPCPQPPPPPKEQIKLETVAQNEKADARVQFAADLSVEEENLDLAKAIVHLADSIARGDAKTLKPMLTRRAQSLLDTLQNSGEWEEATKQIEAVRVVLMRDGVDLGGVGAPKMPGDEKTADLMAKVMEAVKGIPPEQLAAIGKAATEAMAGIDPAALAADPTKIAEFQSKILEAMKAAGISEEVQEKLTAEMGKDAPGAAPAEPAPSSGSGMGVLIAVQDVHGSYLLGWSAQKVGDQWAFANAPATPEIRPRASLWDNVGPEGFQAMQLVSAPGAPRSFGDDSSGSGGKGGGGGGGGGGEGSDPSSPAPSSPSPSPSPTPTLPNSPYGKHPHG